MMYRVSHVEAFREWEEEEHIGTDELIRKILGTEPPTQAMEAGTAFHAVLENAYVGEVMEHVVQDTFAFTFADDFELEVTPIREVRCSRTYIVDRQPIVISGKVDNINALRIEDHKTTAYFDAGRYLEGYQWRLYLHIFGANVFKWNVFEWHEIAAQQQEASPDPEATAESAFALAPTTYEVLRIHHLTQYRYPELESDCQQLVERFARFVRQHVEPLLKEAA